MGGQALWAGSYLTRCAAGLLVVDLFFDPFIFSQQLIRRILIEVL